MLSGDDLIFTSYKATSRTNHIVGYRIMLHDFRQVDRQRTASFRDTLYELLVLRVVVQDVSQGKYRPLDDDWGQIKEMELFKI